MNWRGPMLGAMALLAMGCGHLHFMNSPIPEACLAACDRWQVAPTDFILTVNISAQTVALYEAAAVSGTPAGADRRYACVKKFRCSTSRFGIGQLEGSNCTPLGLHCIGEKIGEGVPAGTVFKSREVVGHTSQPELANAKITTRIMWLEGLEPGFNRDGSVDSHRRYIYIHGTGDQTTIGQPSSCGCVHLADADLVWLFDRLPLGTLVWIAER